MCEPTTAMLAITAITAGASYVAADKQADAQEAAIEASQQATELANAAQIEELNGSTMDEKSDLAREAMVRRGQLRVATGESGVGGLVVDSLMQDVDAQTGRAISRVEENRLRGIEQIRRGAASSAANNQSRMSAINRPSWLQTGAQVAGQGLSIYAANPIAKNQTKTTTTNPRNVAQNGGR